MGTFTSKTKNIFSVSPNIIMSIDDNEMGEMYIYDDDRGYILNGMTASDLIDYFAYNDDINLSLEIIDVLMDMTIIKGTH